MSVSDSPSSTPAAAVGSPPARTGGLRMKIGASIAACAVVTSLVVGVPTAAHADTGGYGRLTIDRYFQPQFEFGIPAWVTSNTTQRSVAKGACSAYLGNKLGLKWVMWWATDYVCGVAIDRFWKEKTGVAVCGVIPLRNVKATRIWQC